MTNGGAGELIDVDADTGASTLPLAVAICETDPVTSGCMDPEAPALGFVATFIRAGATPTFAGLVDRAETVPFDPAVNRVFVRFRDKVGRVDRGATCVAVDGR